MNTSPKRIKSFVGARRENIRKILEYGVAHATIRGEPAVDGVAAGGTLRRLAMDASAWVSWTRGGVSERTAEI
jgi:hypothetical protein